MPNMTLSLPVWLTVFTTLLLLPPGEAPGQRDGLRIQPGSDATTIALQWVTGRFRMPVTCIRKDGSRIELEEALVIRPAPEHGGNTTLKATFFGIDAANVSRCYNLVTPRIPDRRGILYLTFRSHERPDLGIKDFQRRLREGALHYPIRAGQLRERGFGEEKQQSRTIKFSRRGINLIIRPIHHGSDADKLLSRYTEGKPALRQARRFELEIQGPDEFGYRGYFIEDPEWRR